jgi:hypothetical protein
MSGTLNVIQRRCAPPKPQAPNFETCENVSSYLGYKSFLALIAMRDKIAYFTKARPIPRAIALPKKQAVEVRCTEVSSHHPLGAVAQIIIQHLVPPLSAVRPVRCATDRAIGKPNRRVQCL